MPRLSKLLLLFVFVLSLFTIHYSLFTGRVRGQVPAPRVPCGSDRDPEFHSLRPYQASPCGDSSKALYCGNDIVLYETASHTETSWGDNSACDKEDWTVHKRVNKTYEIALKDMELPILGNTQDVKNSQNSAEGFDDAQKLNEYVSWYLSGANSKAEDGESTIDQIVNYSGPVQKLLPSAIQDLQRITTIQSVSTTVAVDPESGETSEGGEPSNHNQTVVCESGGKAVECPGGTELKLKDWEGGLGIARDISNLARNLASKFPGIGDLINTYTTEAYDKRIPPLPWEYDTNLEYQKAYNEWQGKSCVIVPQVNQLFCIDNPLVVNKWADLYEYIPLANTSDKNAKVVINRVEIRKLPDTELDVDKPGYQILDEPALFFAHAQEDSQLASLLQSSYNPKEGTSEDLDPKTTEPDTDEKGQCRVVDVRSNEGDNLFPEVDPDSYIVRVEPYFIETIPKKGNCKCGPNKFGIDVCSQNYEGGVIITIKTQTKTPNAEEIYKKAVSGNNSVFRRIYPKVEQGSPVSCIANIPTVSKATYEIVRDADSITVVEPDNTKTDGTGSKLYFPYIGSVYEYFLKGIQAALRPQGYAEQPVDGQYCENVQCKSGEGKKMPNLPSASGACKATNTSVKIPDNLKKAIEGAAQAYSVPANLLIGVMYGEGAFNPGSNFLKEDFVKANLNSCTLLPNCDPNGDIIKNIVEFFPNYADSLFDAVNKIDPQRKTNYCNLLDGVFALAKDLSQNKNGYGGFSGKSCFGIPLNSGSSTASGCNWGESDIETAIKMWENGVQDSCYTSAGSCAGGTSVAPCPINDTGDPRECETKTNFVPSPSHNRCIWEIARP